MGLVVGTIRDACISFGAWLDHDPFFTQNKDDKDKITHTVFSKIDGGFFPREKIRQNLLQFLPMNLACRVTRAVQRIFEHRNISQFFQLLSKQGQFGRQLQEKTREEILSSYSQFCAGDIRIKVFCQNVTRLAKNASYIAKEVKKIFDRDHINASHDQDLLISVFADTQTKSHEGYFIENLFFCPNRLSIKNSTEELVSVHKTCPPLTPFLQQWETKFEFYKQNPIDSAIDLGLHGFEPCLIIAIDPSLHGGQVEKGGIGSEEELFRRSNVLCILDPTYNQTLKQKYTEYFNSTERNSLQGLAGIYTKSMCVFKNGLEEDYTCRPPIMLPCIFASPHIMKTTQGCPPLWQEFDSHFARESIRNILRIAALRGHKDVVISAFGCEGQGHDPAISARFFGEIFNAVEFKNRFRLVRFALPAFRGNPTDYKAFLADSGLRSLSGMSPQEKRIEPPSEQTPIPTKRTKPMEKLQIDVSFLSSSGLSYGVVKGNVEPFIQKAFSFSGNGKSPSIQVSSSHLTKQKPTSTSIDFNREKLDIPAHVVSITYDSHYRRFLAFVRYADQEERHIFAPEGLNPGDEIISSDSFPRFTIGSSTRLIHIPIGFSVHCIELNPGEGAKLAISSGMGGEILAREGSSVWVKMPSGQNFLLHGSCRATIGVVRK